VGEKRGAHLALSLERLRELAGEELVRIGLSATQKPIEEVAAFLTGRAEPGAPAPECVVIDAGHRRRMDLGVEIPESPLTAVMSGEVWEEVYGRIEELIAGHGTTLLFVNTRRLAERVAHRLSQTLGEDKVAAHHGSLSRDRRFDAEQRLKSGALKALVATASLELGIDIGSVDLVIQIGNPKSISAFLQRVGRSGHAVGALPKGRLFPLTLGELAESAALLDAVRRGELDRLSIPPRPLDILAQQIVAEAACREWSGEALYRAFRRAHPYRDLEEKEFREIVDMLAQGFTTRRGRRGAHIHHDGINDRLRGRPGARLTALTNGGAIPDTFDYDVKLEPGNVLLGTVNEDFAIDSMAGDVFLLGNNSWRITRIEGSTVRVADAHGEPPTIPFWFGEAPGRSEAFSVSVSRLREEVSSRLGDAAALQEKVEIEGSGPGAPWKSPALRWLEEEVGLGTAAADQLVDYLAAAKLSLGVMPTRETLVLERFFDDAGDMHMVLHSPFGSRMNRAWGLSLRKRFCKKFNFELQAAATEDCIILSLGATHSFPLHEVFQYLRPASVRHILVQALLDAPMFEVRWRWNATRALALLRNRGGKKVPPQLQRMAAEDLVALVFPDQRACFENIQGEREVPDHPLVRQTIEDCLTEAMDIEGLECLLADVEAGRMRLEARDLKEPSSLAQEVIHARPYAFLDDAPLEERRTRAIRTRPWNDPAEAGDLGRLDPRAIEAVRAEAWPQVRSADELHDALMLTGVLTAREVETGMPEHGIRGGSMDGPGGAAYGTGDAAGESGDTGGAGWSPLLEDLKAANRVAGLTARPGAAPLWVAAERLPQALAAFPGAILLWKPDLPGRPDLFLPLRKSAEGAPTPAVGSCEAAGFCETGAEADPEAEALAEILRGRLEASGPIRSVDVSASLGLPVDRVDFALMALEQEGFALRGHFTSGHGSGGLAAGDGGMEWCERRLLARIHRYTLARLRREIEPVSAAEYLRFLFAWQGIAGAGREAGAPGPAGVSAPEGFAASGSLSEQASGPDAVEAVLARLEGYEAPCAAWEKDILPARIAGYQPAWLDLQGLSGQFIWGRVRPAYGGLQSVGPEGKVRSASPMKATPVAFLGRENVDLWLAAAGDGDCDGPMPPDAGGPAGAVFDHLRNRGACFWREILRDTGLSPERAKEGIAELAALGWLTSDGFRGLRTLLHPGMGLEKAGRWSLLRQATPAPRKTEGGRNGAPVAGKDLETLARVLLRRYGVVFRKLADRENLTPPWRDLVRAFRLLEARGEVRGGRFVEGFYGEQFALPEAVGLLRTLRRKEKAGELVSLSAADPANLQGILTPGPRVPGSRKNRVLYRDGLPIAALEGGEVRILHAENIDSAQASRPWEKVLRNPAWGVTSAGPGSPQAFGSNAG
jgi:ATP-dependent Lhr-like helicase